MNDIDEILSSRYKEICELIEELLIEEKVSIQTKPTLATRKASLFLLFYNLIESVIFTSFELLFDEICCNCSDYSLLTTEVQLQYKKYDKNNTLNPNDLITLSLQKYERQITLFSGNLDARSIRKLLSAWGINTNFHVDKEEKIRDIKEFRNTLAHGEKAFKEIGRNYTTQELCEYCTVLYSYLSTVVDCFRDYIQHRKYMKN